MTSRVRAVGAVRWLFVATGVAILARNLIGLATVPDGVYIDESSIGYNAWALAHYGADEHGVMFPLYPEAFGDYKNPVYVYVLAALSRLFGMSITIERLPAALFGWVACLALSGAALHLTRSRLVAWLALVLAGVTPWLTLESRVGFEVVSMVTALSVMLWCLARATPWDDEARGTGWRRLWRRGGRPGWYLAAGVAAGIAVFAYSTARLEVGLFAIAFALSYGLPWRQWAWTAAGPIAVAYGGLFWWMQRHPNALLARFNAISITTDPLTHTARPLSSVLPLFWANYWQYLGPRFLLFDGDANLRHSTGWGGMFLLPTGVLIACGVFWCARHAVRALPRFLLLAVVVAPVAAALTDNGTPHALRAAAALPSLLLIAACGCHAVIQAVLWSSSGMYTATGRRFLRRATAVAILLAILWPAGWFTADLFTLYPARAAREFDGGEIQLLAEAHTLGRGHTVFVVADAGMDYQPYIDAAFIVLPPPPSWPVADSVTPLMYGMGMRSIDDPAGAWAADGDLIVAGIDDPPPPGTVAVWHNTRGRIYRVVADVPGDGASISVPAPP